MSDHQTLNEQVFGDGLPMFPPHLCCCGTSAIGRASYKRQVASEREDQEHRTMSETTPQDDAAMSPASDGSVTAEPVAWLVTGDGYEYATLLKEHAEVIAEEEDGAVVPLYRQPTLTDAEREAIEWASLVLRNTAEELDQHGDYPRRLNEAAALMLNLLQRLK